jgi:hypothetical protein
MKLFNNKLTEKILWGSVLWTMVNEHMRLIFALLIIVMGITELTINILISLSYKNTGIRKFTEKFNIRELLIIRDGKYKAINTVILICIWLCYVYLVFSSREFFAYVILIVILCAIIRLIIAILDFKIDPTGKI